MSLHELFFGLKPETIARHHECFQITSDDPMTRQRSVAMEVLSLGFSRTGTASMYAALTELGYETYHGFRAFADIRDYELWNIAAETKYFGNASNECQSVDQQFFDRVLGHIGAVTDMPCTSFAIELMEAYPKAKVVLVEREEDAWFRSFESVFIKTYESQLVRWVAWFDPAKAGQLIRFLTRATCAGMFNATSAEQFRDRARPVYREHYSSIRKFLRERGEEERLLEYDLGTGWEPLCNFLGKQAPTTIEFPRVNETAMTEEKIRVMVVVAVRRAARVCFICLFPVLLAGISAWYLSPILYSAS